MRAVGRTDDKNGIFWTGYPSLKIKNLDSPSWQCREGRHANTQLAYRLELNPMLPRHPKCSPLIVIGAVYCWLTHKYSHYRKLPVLLQIAPLCFPLLSPRPNGLLKKGIRKGNNQFAVCCVFFLDRLQINGLQQLLAFPFQQFNRMFSFSRRRNYTLQVGFSFDLTRWPALISTLQQKLSMLVRWKSSKYIQKSRQKSYLGYFSGITRTWDWLQRFYLLVGIFFTVRFPSSKCKELQVG